MKFADKNDIEMILKYDKHISRDELSRLIGTKRVLICTHNGEFAGWLRYNLFWDNTPFMNMLFILKEYRGLGYGYNLVFFWEKLMRDKGFNYVMTSTQADEYAQHFYRKLGYTDIGSFIPGKGTLELIFEKNLLMQA